MTTFEMCSGIRRLIMNTTAEVMNYISWGSEYSYKRIMELPEKIKGKGDFKFIDPTELTLDEMKELGFNRWSSDNPIMLIPLWLMPFIDPKVEVTDIEGEKSLFKDADNDNRYGCLAYGVNPKN